jgi:predicted ATP-dependent endonuclease of OLD family
LPGLNIIIGPNGSGKTNFLEFLKLSFGEYGNLSYEIIRFESKIEFINIYQDSVSLDISAKLKIVKSLYYFIIEEESSLNQKKIEKKIMTFSEIGTYVKNQSELFVSEEESRYFGHRIIKPDLTYIKYGVSSWYDDRLRNSLQITINRHENSWHSHGKDFYVIYNWINYIYKSDKVEEYISHLFYIDSDFKLLLQKYSPIKDIKFNNNRFLLTEINENEYTLANINLSFYVNDRWSYWQDLSDGTRRIFYIIAEFYSNTGPPPTVFLEEPELGIHPDQLYKLMDFLKEQSKEKQIIITTHSPEVLNILGKDELDHIIVTRYDEEKGTQMHHLSPKQIRKGQIYIEEVGDLKSFWVHSNLEAYEAE